MLTTLPSLLALALFAFFSYWSYFYLANYFKIKDLANLRSAHNGEVIRGAGIIFSFIFILFLSFRYAQNPDFIKSSFFWTLVISSILFSSIGFVDDLLKISSKNRLISQIIICFITTLILTPQDWYLYDAWPINYPITLLIIFLYLLSFINFFNFMDGINGLATIQSLLVLIPLSLMGYSFSGIYQVLGVLVLVFLGFNFPKAKMFMGDSGSYFLGIFLATSIIYHTFLTDTNAFFALNTLLLVFWIDPVVTLIFRLSDKKNILEAHNQHLYQKLSRVVESHTRIVFLFVVFYLVVLLPIAYLIWVSKPAISAGIFLFLCLLLVGLFSFLQLRFRKI